MDIRPKLFLEDVGIKVASKNGKDVWRVDRLGERKEFSWFEERGDIPGCIYVVDFRGEGVGQKFLLGRHICGPEKAILMRETCHEMARLFTNQCVGRIGQIVILYGGGPLDMQWADPPMFPGFVLDSTAIKLERVHDHQAKRGFHVEKRAMTGRWWPDDTWIVLEECIASGRTLEVFAEEHAFRHHKPKKLFVFPVIASWQGLCGLNRQCSLNGVEFVPVVNSALIQVAERGVTLPNTDLGLHPLTIVSRAFHEVLWQRYQGKQICWVGDVGESIFDVHAYLVETFQHMAHFHMDFEREDFNFWHPAVFLSEFHAKLQNKEPELFERVRGFIAR